MDPLVSLHYYAPVCFAINAIILPFVEGVEPFFALNRVGIFVFLTNAGVAFALNVSIPSLGSAVRKQSSGFEDSLKTHMFVVLGCFHRSLLCF